MPNLAKDWSWNDERSELTLDLVQGVRWSDENPFDAADVQFWWEDNVRDENVSAWMTPNGIGDGTTLDIVDDHTVKFNFAKPKGPSRVASLAFIQGCPGSSLVLMEHHPKYNSNATYYPETPLFLARRTCIGTGPGDPGANHRPVA